MGEQLWASCLEKFIFDVQILHDWAIILIWNDTSLTTNLKIDLERVKAKREHFEAPVLPPNKLHVDFSGIQFSCSIALPNKSSMTSSVAYIMRLYDIWVLLGHSQQGRIASAVCLTNSNVHQLHSNKENTTPARRWTTPDTGKMFPNSQHFGIFMLPLILAKSCTFYKRDPQHWLSHSSYTFMATHHELRPVQVAPPLSSVCHAQTLLRRRLRPMRRWERCAKGTAHAWENHRWQQEEEEEEEEELFDFPTILTDCNGSSSGW